MKQRSDIPKSPFHEGEKTIQRRVGQREAIERFGRRVVRSFLPEQHRVFYAQLPFLVVGSVDADGWPWASMVFGQPGFVTSPTNQVLTVQGGVAPGDPLAAGLAVGAPLGFLGIEIPTRRRNRLNARVTELADAGFSVSVDQAFGNCPQYVQTRDFQFVRDPATESGVAPEALVSLDAEARATIAGSDTLFVASYVSPKDSPEIEGVDVSHRGGRPGFVKVDGNTLTIPDYSGNNHFNTLGNFLINPKAGLLFVDFETGDLLFVTGTVELLWEDNPEVLAFRGAERAWRCYTERAIRLRDALPLRASFNAYSPNTLLTGDWDAAERTMAAHRQRESWRPYRIERIEDESDVIRSLYLTPADGGANLPFEAGQFLTLRVTPQEAPVVRTYTVSSSPSDAYYRVSVKREEAGYVSKYLHDLAVGDVIEAKAPQGDFWLDPSVRRPAVLLAGGVGITPMMSMARHVVDEGLRTRHYRPLTILHAARSTRERAFFDAFRKLAEQSGGAVSYYSFVGAAAEGEKAGVDYNGTGRISADVLRQVLALDDYDFYLCGPPGFMQAMYDAIRELGVRDARVFAEAFGPAALTRTPDDASFEIAPVPEAEEALIKFVKSDFEQAWQRGGGTLLDTAEAHGLSPAYGCRRGACGRCKVKLVSGKVTYRTPPSAKHAADEVLLCCAVPAEGSELVQINL